MNLSTLEKKPEVVVYISGKKKVYRKNLERVSEDALADFVSRSIPKRPAKGSCGGKKSSGEWGTCLLFVDGHPAAYKGLMRFMFDAFAHKFEGKVDFQVQASPGVVGPPAVLAYCWENQVGTISLDATKLKRKKTPLSLASKFGTWIMGFYGGKKCTRRVEL